MASFFIVVVFLPLQAPADYQPAPGGTDGVPERHQRQWIINPSLQICAWNFNRTQVVDKGIRQKSTKE